MFCENNIVNYKYWDSAYLRQGTFYQCRDPDPDCHQNLIVCSLAIAKLPWKFHPNPFRSFGAELLTDRQPGKQTDRQTDKQRRLRMLLGGDK